MVRKTLRKICTCIQIYNGYPYDDFMTTQPEKFHKHDLIIELAALV